MTMENLMKKQLPQLLLPALLCTLFAVSPIASGQTKETRAPHTNSEKRDLVLQKCLREEKKCICLAGQLIESMSEKEWVIMSALYENAEKPPQGVTAADLDTFIEKFEHAGKTCDIK